MAPKAPIVWVGVDLDPRLGWVVTHHRLNEAAEQITVRDRDEAEELAARLAGAKP